MNLFFAPPRDIHGNQIVIRGQEAEHITRVLRMSVGDSVAVTDGAGTLYHSEITDVRNKDVFLEIRSSEKVEPESRHTILCLGFIRKRDRLEFAVEKCVELGVRRIVIFRGENSQKGGIRMDRLESTALAAMKQSLRCHLPEVFVENSLKQAIDQHASDSTIVLADEQEDVTSKPKVSGERIFMIVGPEGGFSEEERRHLQDYNPVMISLGRFRLRAETAAVVMAATFTGR